MSHKIFVAYNDHEEMEKQTFSLEDLIGISTSNLENLTFYSEYNKESHFKIKLTKYDLHEDKGIMI
jgi:hypothetical protein